MSAEKYPSIFSRQMPTIVYLLHKHQDFSFLPKKIVSSPHNEDTIFMFLLLNLIYHSSDALTRGYQAGWTCTRRQILYLRVPMYYPLFYSLTRTLYLSYVVVNKATKILTNIMTDKTKKTKYRKTTTSEVKLVMDSISSKWVIPNTDQTSCLADL